MKFVSSGVHRGVGLAKNSKSKRILEHGGVGLEN